MLSIDELAETGSYPFTLVWRAVSEEELISSMTTCLSGLSWTVYLVYLLDVNLFELQGPVSRYCFFEICSIFGLVMNYDLFVQNFVELINKQRKNQKHRS